MELKTKNAIHPLPEGRGLLAGQNKQNLTCIEIIPVEGKNGLYRINLKEDKDRKVPTISEISKILRKPIPKI